MGGVIGETAGPIDLPVEFLGYKHLVPIRFAPTLDCKVLLGHDFAEIFDFEIKFKHRIWGVREGLWRSYEGNVVQAPRTPSDKRSMEKGLAQRYLPCAALKELEPNQAQYLQDVLTRKIPPMPPKLPATPLAQHVIDVQGHPAIKQKYHRCSRKVMDALREAVEKLEEQELIELSVSEWCNPTVMVKKADGA